MTMALTRDFKKTVVARVERDPEFANALLDEAATLFLSGETETARLLLHDLVNATLGFERLAKVTVMPSKSLHRMLSPKGNPSMDNLAANFRRGKKAPQSRPQSPHGQVAESGVATDVPEIRPNVRS